MPDFSAVTPTSAATVPLFEPSAGRYVPVSLAQQRLWFLDQLERNSPEYNMPAAVRLRGAVDRAALQRAVDLVAQRHETLRTRFVEIDGRPMQCVEPVGRVVVHYDDYAALPASERQTALARIVARELDERFDLAAAPPWRVRLIRFADDDFVLLRIDDHLLRDAWE